MITTELLLKIKEQFKIDWWGLHGITHFHHVFLNSRLLAQKSGTNSLIYDYFSIFHDSCRQNEGIDKDHGKRGAGLALQLRHHIQLDETEFLILQNACSNHTSLRSSDCMTSAVCADADRCDIGRVGSYPDRKQLLSPLAKKKEIIEQCYQRSLTHDLPEYPFGLSDFWDAFDGDKYTKWAKGTKK